MIRACRKSSRASLRVFAPLREDKFSRKGAKTQSKTQKAEGFEMRHKNFEKEVDER
jgi:hypothetical protein